ncbi:STAS domain-containing protein [Marinifilum caeruleilacunae]|uniref:Anti-sigma factor antagonist n=1 Tax=Marinifilum caeruleilacunae TaxID=2499076 RepID=A0ABX1WVG1_9BACT|nr:STAS domain-containing protein [Marinifilum caeruleilacunae]NOU60072.1 anti-sigma factor antagonist [Marinifilum caeruleilacunae]
MLNFRIQEQSVIASLEGTRRINGMISEMVKSEIIDFIEKSGKQVVLDLNGVSFVDTQGFSALKAIAELAKANERLFSLANCSDDVLELVELVEMRESFSIGKN